MASFKANPHIMYNIKCIVEHRIGETINRRHCITPVFHHGQWFKCDVITASNFKDHLHNGHSNDMKWFTHVIIYNDYASLNLHYTFIISYNNYRMFEMAWACYPHSWMFHIRSEFHTRSKVFHKDWIWCVCLDINNTTYLFYP